MKQPLKRPKTSKQVAEMMRTGKGIDAAVRRAIRKAVKRGGR